MRKIIWRSTLALVLALSILCTFLLSSSGLRLGLSIASSFLPGKFSYKSVSGLITGPIQLRNIDYHYGAQEIRIKSLEFNWSLWALFLKKLSLRDVHAKDIVIINHTKEIQKSASFDFRLFYKKNPFEAYTDNANALAQQYKKFLQNFKLSWDVSIQNAHLGHILYFSPENKRIFEFTEFDLDGKLSERKMNFSIDSLTSFPYAAKLQATISGNSSHYQLNFSALGKQVDFKINGEGNAHEITLTTAKTRVLNGLIQGNFHLNWNDDLTWQTELNINDVNFSSLYAKWPSSFEANIHSKGILTQKNPQFALTTKIKTKNASIDLNVEHKNDWLANWNISLAKGQYLIQGELSGPFENPLTTGTLQVRNFTYLDYSATKLKAQWKINLGENSPADISLSADQLHSKNISADKLALNFAGTLNQHQITLSADFDQSSMDLKLAGSIKEKTWSAKLLSWNWGEFHLPAQDGIQLQVSLPNYTSGLPKTSQKLNATLQANLSNLAFISDLIPDLTVKKGEILGKLSLTGTFEKPLLNGNLDFSQGTVLIPAWDLTLTDAKITSKAIGPVINYSARAISGKQPVTIVGDTDFSKTGIPTHLKISGKDILLVNTQEYTIYGSPDVSATIVGTRLDLSGNILVPSGLIRPHDFRNITQLPTNEVTFVGMPKIVGQSKWEINTNLNIIAGENLIVDSFGIHGFLNGTIHIIQTPNQTLLANGKIGIRKGFYRAYGHQLKISHGSFMQFTNSPINNPVLSIQATRKVSASAGSQIQALATEKIIVGMNIHGPLNNPDIDLFSSSGNLSQSAILSYILTGGSGGNNSPFGAPNNTNAQGSFSYTSNILDAVKLGASGVGGTDDLISKIQSGLGFSELGFESDTTLDAIGNPLGSQTNFVIGRHLAKGLYLRYTRGIYGPGLMQGNKITLRYLFRGNWAIQLDSDQYNNGSDYGADILYTKERD